MSAKYKYIIGIDEVGRGALAGPVVVVALALPIKKKFKIKPKDSKKLTPKQREAWFNYVKKSILSYGIVSVPPKTIDKINISQAANLAAANAFGSLIKKFKIKNCRVYLDGGLYINKSKLQFKNIKIKTVIKGDEKIKAISLASIVAKVRRDKLMKRLHKKYPRYDFIHNVGYGTKKHIKAIKKYGYSAIHRRSFCKNFPN